MEFNILGCKVKIEFSFVLMLCFAVLLRAESLGDLLLFSSLHEAGHLVTLVLFGGRADSLTLSYYGLALRYSSKLSKLKETAVLMSGVTVNLIFYLWLRDDVNLLLLFINMMPVYPIDFGRVISLYFPKLSRIISTIFLILLMLLAFYLLVFKGSFSMMFIVCYLLIYTLCY